MTDVLVVSTKVAAPRERVWRAVVMPDDRAGWWPDLRLEPRLGAHLSETWREDGIEQRADGAVTEILAGHRLRFRWSQPGWPTATDVSLTLDDVDGGTLVSVEESGLDQVAGPALAEEHRQGWLHHLANLRRYVEEKAA